MDKNSEAYKRLKVVIQTCFGDIGLKEHLSASEDKQYDFQDNLKRTDFYFLGGLLLRESVLSTIKNCKDKTNAAFVEKVFDKIMKDVYGKIKDRKIIFEKTLNNYLIEEDFDFAAERLEEILRNPRKKFKVILISELIELSDIEACQIGNVTIRKINKDYTDTLPIEIESQKDLGVTLLGSFGEKIISRDKFLEEHKEHVALEINTVGYHFDDELSPVFDSAVQEIRLVFAYLFLSRHFSSNVEKEFKFKIETKEIKRGGYFLQSELTGLQEYYLFDKDNTDFLKKFDTTWEKIILSDTVFVLSKDMIDNLKKQCHLDEFNKMNQRSDIGEIKNKINMALDWFLKATLEKDDTDEVISLFISLESLLSMSEDYLTSHTDDMAENIAIMLTTNPDDRYNYKKTFKTNVYSLRNMIMHHGRKFSWDKNYSSLRELRIYVVWSTLGILSRIEKITKYGNGSKAMREYFEREKLKPSIILPPQKADDKS